MDKETYKLQGLKIENFLKVKFAEIKFDNDIVVLGGENAQGKSSVAKALWAAFAGKKGVPEEPVNRGAEESHITIDLDGDLTLKAVIQPDREIALELLDRKGGPYRRAHERLKEFNLHYGFFPNEFLEMDAKTQMDTILKMLGVDLDGFKKRRQGFYDNRTEVNRDLVKERAKLEAAPRYPEAPAELQSVEALMAELNAAQNIARSKETLQANIKKQQDFITEVGNQVTALEAQIEQIKLKIKSCKEQQDKAIAQVKEEQAHLAAIQVPNIDEIEIKIVQTDNVNAKVRANQAYAVIKESVAKLTAEADALTAKIEAVDKEKEDLVRSTKMPVEGLGFSDTGLTLKGFPISQAAEAEQWELAIAVGFAMKPKLRLVYVRRGSQLTPATRQRVYAMVREKDGQALFEIAGDDDDVTVVMEDGYVKETRQEKKVEVASNGIAAANTQAHG